MPAFVVCIFIEIVCCAFFVGEYVYKPTPWHAGMAVAAGLFALALAIINAGNG